MIRRVLSGFADVELSAAAAVAGAVRTAVRWFEGLTGWRRFLADVVFVVALGFLAAAEFVALWYIHH